MSIKDALVQLLPRMGSWNCRSLFCTDPRQRRAKLRVVHALLAKVDVLFLQETHGSHTDFHDAFPEHFVMYSLHPVNARGGVVTIIKSAWVNGRDLSFEEIVPGRCCVTKVCCSNPDEPCLALFNLHLEGESHDAAARKQLLDQVSERVGARDLNLILGDFNCEPPSSERSCRHGSLYKHLEHATEGFCTLVPDMPTCRGSSSLSPRVLDYLRVDASMACLEASKMQLVCVAVDSVINNRLSDHIPIVLEWPRSFCDSIPPIPAAFAGSLEWGQAARARFAELLEGASSLDERVNAVSAACRQATRDMLISREVIDEKQTSLALFIAQSLLHKILRSDFRKVEVLLARVPFLEPF